jgi:hypothetical protein
MKTQSLPPRFGDLLAASWRDWSGFLAWSLRIGLLALVFYAFSLAADWTTARLLEGQPSGIALVGAQALHAGFDGFGFAAGMTIVFLRKFVRSRIPHFFALMWLGFTAFSFVLNLSLPLPLWQMLAIKIPVCIAGFGLVGWILKRWWRDFWIAADAEEEPA